MRSGVNLNFSAHELINAVHNPVTALPNAEVAGRLVYLKSTSEKAFYVSIDSGSSVVWKKLALSEEITTALSNYLKVGTKVNGTQLLSNSNVTLQVDWNDKAGTTAGDVKIVNFPTIGSGSYQLKTTKTNAAGTTTTVDIGSAYKVETDGNLTPTIKNTDIGLDDSLVDKSLTAIYTSPSLTGTPVTVTPSAGSNSKMVANKEYVDSAIDSKLATADAMIYKGAIKIGDYTPAADKGWTYKVIASATGAKKGTIDGVSVETGDMLICNTDGTAAATSSNVDTVKNNWDFIQANLEGYVLGPGTPDSTNAVSDNAVVIFDGTTGKIIKSSKFTLGKSVPATAVFTDASTTKAGHYTPSTADAEITEGSTTTRTYIKQIKLDSKRHVTGVVTGTETVTNTHAVTHMYVNKDGSAADSATAASEDTKVTVYDDSTQRDSVTFKGAGYSTVTSSGKVITITSEDSRTTKTGHYTPGDSDATLDAIANSTANTWDVPVLSEIHVTKDSKGHIIGLTSSSVRIPKQPDSAPAPGNGTLTLQANGTSKGTFTANQSTNTTVNFTASDLGVTSIPVYKVVQLTGTSGTITASGTNGHGCGANIIVQSRRAGAIFILDVTVASNGDITWSTQDAAYASNDNVTLHIMGMKTL